MKKNNKASPAVPSTTKNDELEPEPEPVYKTNFQSNCIGLPWKHLTLKFADRPVSFFQVESGQISSYDEFGRDTIIPLLQKYGVRGYDDLPELMSKFCRATDNRDYDRSNVLDTDDELEDWCNDTTGFLPIIEGVTLGQAIWRMYRDKKTRKVFAVSNKTTHRGRFLHCLKFAVNDLIANVYLGDLKQECQTGEDIVPRIQDYMSVYYSHSLPMDSAADFIEGLDKALVKAVILRHLELFPISKSLAKKTQKRLVSNHIVAVRIAFVLGYEKHFKRYKWTRALLKQIGQKNAMEKARHTERVQERKILLHTNFRQAYMKSTEKCSFLSLFVPREDSHSRFFRYLRDTGKRLCGQSLIEFQYDTGETLSPKWHFMPVPARYKWKFHGDHPLTVYPGGTLVQPILDMLKNSHRGAQNDWSMNSWWNYTFQGALRHGNSQGKGKHLDKHNDFLVFVVTAENDDYFLLKQDTFWTGSKHEIPHNREFFCKKLGPVTPDGVLYFVWDEGQQQYVCVKWHGKVDGVPDKSQLEEVVLLSHGEFNRGPPVSPNLKSRDFRSATDPAPIVIQDVGLSGELEGILNDLDLEEQALQERALPVDATFEDEEDKKPPANPSRVQVIEVDDDEDDRKPAAIPSDEVIELDDDEEEEVEPDLDSNVIAVKAVYPDLDSALIQDMLLQEGNDKNKVMEFLGGQRLLADLSFEASPTNENAVPFVAPTRDHQAPLIPFFAGLSFQIGVAIDPPANHEVTEPPEAPIRGETGADMSHETLATHDDPATRGASVTDMQASQPLPAARRGQTLGEAKPNLIRNLDSLEDGRRDFIRD